MWKFISQIFMKSKQSHLCFLYGQSALLLLSVEDWEDRTVLVTKANKLKNLFGRKIKFERPNSKIPLRKTAPEHTIMRPFLTDSMEHCPANAVPICFRKVCFQPFIGSTTQLNSCADSIFTIIYFSKFLL